MRFGAVIAAALLAVDPFGWDRFGPLRWAVISTLGFVAIAVALGAGDSRSQPLPRWSVIGWVAVITGMGVSSALSTDRWHALIGTPDRHLGLAAWVLFVGLFAVASLYPNSTVSGISRTSVAAAIGCGVWAILEAAGFDAFDTGFADDRVGGPLGQPAFLGAAMLLVIPVAASVAVDRANGWAVRLLGLSGALLGAAALGLSQSRAAWVGASVALICVVLRRRTWLLGALGLAVVVALWFATPLGDRASTLTEINTGVVAGRLDEWQVASRAVFDTPTFGLTGHGPEGYRTVFGAHVDEGYVIRHGRDVITDRAHNGLLDTTLTGGFLAGVGMVLLQAGLLITSLQRMRSADAIDVGLSAAIIGYLTQQFFLFPLSELDPVLWVFSGLLIGRRPQRVEYRPPLFASVSGARQVMMLGAGFLAAVSAVAGLSDVAADHAIDDAVAALDSEDPDAAERALQLADEARSRRPDSIRYDFIAARAASIAGTVEGFEESLERLEAGLETSPTDPAFLEERALVLLEIARRTSDPADLSLALDALELLDASDPNNPSTEMAHGIALALDGRATSGISELEHAAVLDPESIEAVLNVAIIHFENGDLESGRTALERVEALAPSNARAIGLRQEFLSE